MSNISNEQIFEMLQKVHEDFTEVKLGVNDLTIHMKGNGGIGIMQRVDKIEKWKEGRPSTCPATAKEITRRLTRGLAVVGGVISLLVGLSVLGNMFLRNTSLEQMKIDLVELRDAVEGMKP